MVLLFDQMGTPPAEIDINVELVRSLLSAQHPDLAHLPIRPANSGWDNAMFRLGKQLAVRLPRRKLGAELIQKEQQWLSVLSPQIILPAPVPVRIGQPGQDYPWHWSVVPWIAGQTADCVDLRASEAVRLGEFLRSLHTPAPANAPRNSSRGIPLSQRATIVNKSIASLADKTDLITPTIHRIWQQALAAAPTSEDRWIHGDLHPQNILAVGGKIMGVIDWGDLTYGDVATDLATVWMLFEWESDRAECLNTYGASEADRWRAKGWAIAFATILLETGLVNNPSHAAIGRNTLRRLQRMRAPLNEKGTKSIR